MTKESVLDGVAELLAEYHKQYSEPLGFRSISQKWAKVALRAGFDLLKALKEDPRFIVDMDRSAAYRVSLSATVGLNKTVMIFLKQAGGTLSYGELMRRLLSLGHSTDKIKETLTFMQGINAISVQDDIVSLTDAPL